MKQKLIFMALWALLVTPVVFAKGGSVHVRGYTKKSGKYVQPHRRTAPNGTKLDNWSAKGNVNPDTGKHGTK